MAETPRFASPIPRPVVELPGARLTDESQLGKWRFWRDAYGVPTGHAVRSAGRLVLSVAPGEWIAVGDRPEAADAVHLTHVRAALRLTGAGAASVLAGLCSLDLADDMFPPGAAGRTLVAGVATELVRDDEAGAPSYLLLMARSSAQFLHERLAQE